jgi:hypothetical protein
MRASARFAFPLAAALALGTAAIPVRADLGVAGDVLATRAGACGLLRIEPNTNRRSDVAPDLCTWDIALTPDGDLIAIGNDVQRVDFETGALSTLHAGRPWSNVQGIAVAPDGLIYFADDAGSLFELDPVSGDLRLLMSRIHCQVNCSRAQLAGLVRTRSGAFFATLRGRSTGDPGYVVELDVPAQTARIVSAAGVLSRPWGVIEDVDGRLLVADRAAIYRIDPVSGAQATLAQEGKLLSPYHLALGDNGRIYLTELDSSGFIVGGSQIVEIDPTTGIQRILARPVSVRGIVVVPGEPAPPACSDGLDNDGDHRRDFPRDRGCSSPSDGTEEPPCRDGIDNDQDGAIDHPDDPGCGSDDPLAQEAPQCSDARDNDGDGLYDHPEDPECLVPHDNTEHWSPFEHWFGRADATPLCGLLGIEAVLVLGVAGALRRRKRAG